MRTIFTLVVCLGLLITAPLVFAEKGDKAQRVTHSDEDVYITPNGKKYHKPECPFVHDRQVTKVSKKEAIEKKLAPCPKCFKEDLPENKEKK